MVIPENGYLYIAIGEQYIKEAIVSAESLRKVDNKAHITLITNKRIECSLFDIILLRHSLVINSSKLNENQKLKKSMKLFKPYYMYDSPYKKTFFIDTDTYFCDNCRELFNLLNYSDICLAPAASFYFQISFDSKALNGLNSYNSGVLIFKKSLRNKMFFKRWAKIYMGNDNYAMDQQALMETIMKSRLKISYISNIYNALISLFIGLPPLKVKILHGRNCDFKKIESIINSVLENRSWNPLKQEINFIPVNNFKHYLNNNHKKD